MSKKQLNGAEVGALLQEVNGKCMPQRVRGDGLGNFANTVGFSALQLPSRTDRYVGPAYRRERASVQAFPLATTVAGSPTAWGRALRSNIPSLALLCSTRPTMRLLSTAGGVRAMASETRKPAA
jgi:hypothetical protein